MWLEKLDETRTSGLLTTEAASRMVQNILDKFKWRTASRFVETHDAEQITVGISKTATIAVPN